MPSPTGYLLDEDGFREVGEDRNYRKFFPRSVTQLTLIVGSPAIHLLNQSLNVASFVQFAQRLTLPPSVTAAEWVSPQEMDTNEWSSSASPKETFRG